MKVVVAYKWAASPDEAEVDDQGAVNWSRAKASFSEYDAVAAELGRQLVDGAGGQLIGVSVGGPAAVSSLARKGALSRGLDSVVLVGDAPEEAQGPLGTARSIAALVSRVGDVDVLLAGDASVDMAAGIVPAIVGGVLGWPVLTQVTDVAVSEAGLRVVRSVPGGSEVVRVTTPAVLTAAADAVATRMPGMKEILAAGKKPSEVVAWQELSLASPPVPAAASATRASGPARKGVLIDGGDAAGAAGELASALKAAGCLPLVPSRD